MTPLAQQILNYFANPHKRIAFKDEGDILSAMRGAHFFDVSDVHELASDLAENVGKIVGSSETSFLPAPKTWIEYADKDDPSKREGWILEESKEDRQLCYLTHITRGKYLAEYGDERDGIVCEARDENLLMHLVTGPVQKKNILGIRDGWHSWGPDNLLLAFLMFINTPRVIGRRQHMPHRGLEKKLLNSKGPIGNFPLNAWTEILLHVTPSTDTDGGDHEAHLTGKKALHFCRAHLRVRLGKLECVRSHWRGDASLGTKQSKYRVSA